MYQRSFPVIFLFVIFALVCCSDSGKHKTLHDVKFFHGNSKNKIEVLDFGGSGRPVIFLAGLGNSAHVFDSFATKFTDDFHVFAFTRRGFGASEGTGTGYDLKNLTADILAVIDSLHLSKPILIGHSIAGEEISELAAKYPDRFDKIVYLDAAYDRTGVDTLMKYMPEQPKMSTQDSSSVANLNKFMKKNYGITLPEEEITQTTVLTKEGKLVRDITPDSVYGVLMRIAKKPEYALIKCAALGIYSDPVKESMFPMYATLDSLGKLRADTAFKVYSAFAVQQQSMFGKEVKNAVSAKIAGSNHYVFITHSAETEKLIKDFLQ